MSKKLTLLVNDGSIIPHGEPIKHFQSFTEFDGDDTKGEEEETRLLKSQKSQEKKFPYYFYDSEETETTHWGRHEPLPLPKQVNKNVEVPQPTIILLM